MADVNYDSLRATSRDLMSALDALALAMSDHPNDTYLQGQAREHVWLCYWRLRGAANDFPLRRERTPHDAGALEMKGKDAK